jgi:Ig-like domain from next to BRCA1 gene
VIRAAWLLRFGEQRSKGNINWNVQLTNSPEPGDSWDNSDDPQTCYAGPMTQGTWQVCPSGGSVYYDGYYTIDGTAVHMDTGSTAALYWYTPHFAGNQNFFTIYTNWFGSTTVAGYAWTTTGYTITSLDGNTKYDPGQLQPGQTYLATLEAKNVGSATWTNNGPTPVTLGTTDGNSMFCNSTWVACNRPAYLQETSVAPEQEGHFVFRFQAPYKVGAYREYFKPVAEELTWFNDDLANESLGIWVVSPGSYAWWTNGYTVTSLDGNTRYDPGLLQPGQTYLAKLDAVNVGSATWTNNGPEPVTLASVTGYSFCNSTWVACNRPAYLQEASVAPGQTGHFVFRFQAPYAPGQYREYFKPVAEMYTWFGDIIPNESLGIWVVSPGTFTWSMSVYKLYDQTGTTRIDPGQLQQNQTYLAAVDATNTGTATWYNNGPIVVRFATSDPTSRMSSLCTDTWIGCNRPAGLTESSVAPGQIGHFSFLFKTPAVPGVYYESFKPVAELFTWFNDDPNDLFGMVVN